MWDLDGQRKLWLLICSQGKFGCSSLGLWLHFSQNIYECGCHGSAWICLWKDTSAAPRGFHLLSGGTIAGGGQCLNISVSLCSLILLGPELKAFRKTFPIPRSVPTVPSVVAAPKLGPACHPRRVGSPEYHTWGEGGLA